MSRFPLSRLFGAGVVITLTCGLMAGGVMASLQSISLESKEGPAPKREAGLIERDVVVRFDNGSIRYRGMTRTPASDDGAPRPIVTEKWGDYFFGLTFFRQNKNGGWNGWDFLRATILTADGKRLQPQRQHLAEVHLLERDERMLVMLEWPLVNEQGQAQGKLVVTMVQYEAQPQWMFTRVWLEDTDATLDSVELSAYPGSAASTPPERERWLSTPEAEQMLTNRPAPLAMTSPGAVALFNRFADIESGCFLVYDRAQHQEISVRAVMLRFTPVKGSQAVTFALGGYRDAPRESDRAQAIYMFMTEHASQALGYMQGINWRPNLPLAQYDQLMQDVAEYLPRVADDAQKARYQELKAAYDKAKADKAYLQVLEAVEPVRQLKEALLESLLKQYR